MLFAVLTAAHKFFFVSTAANSINDSMVHNGERGHVDFLPQRSFQTATPRKKEKALFTPSLQSFGGVDGLNHPAR